MQEEEKQKFLHSVKNDINFDDNKSSDIFSYFVIGLFCAVIVLIIVVFGLQKSKQVKLASIDTAIASDVTEPLKSLEKEKQQSDIVAKQLEVLTTALSSRVKYSQLMSDLTANQYKKSKWTSFAFQSTAISLSGSADSFDDVAKTVAAFRVMKAVQDISLKSVSLNQDSKKVDFTLEITVNKTLYNYLPKTQAATGTESVGQ